MYERFAQLLEEAKVSSYRVSKDTGISQTTLSAWKLGLSTPKLDKLEAIAKYFDVTLDWLLGKTNDKKGYAGIDLLVREGQPKFAPKQPKDLKKLLKDEKITLNGRLMTDEDKEKMYKIIEAAFWDAKAMNKRKKSIEFTESASESRYSIKE